MGEDQYMQMPSGDAIAMVREKRRRFLRRTGKADRRRARRGRNESIRAAT